jgi:MinD-like ATPase involved in chromosome partitioning or flagellar assembly
MMTFDRVLPELIRTCEDDAGTRAAIRRYCVVRDVRGRVRLIVEPMNGSAIALGALEASIVAALGDYFVAPIVSAQSGGDVQRLARQLLEKAHGRWPRGWPVSIRNVIGADETAIDVGARWTGIERTVGKEAWLTSTPPKPPWPLLNGKTPAIVTFHSFKGGVGRTTLVASYAIRVASDDETRRIAILDLDLEAPGIGSLLGAETERGVLDVLVDHIATGRIDLEGASSPAQLGGSIGSRITVFGAGRADEAYVQKLARLDFSSTEPGVENPVGAALSAMLKTIKSSFDVILLDSRAGLHDLAGMSLHGLAHVDVLAFRGTAQNLAGLSQTLRTLGSRDDAQLVLIETMLPSNDDELFETRRTRTRERVYELLCEHVYAEEEPPQIGDVGEPHDVVPVRRRDWLDGLDSMQGHVMNVLAEADLEEVARRIDDACTIDGDDTSGGGEADE